MCSKLIVYIISQTQADYKTNFRILCRRKTCTLYRKSCQSHTLFPKAAACFCFDPQNRTQKSPSGSGRAFLHTKRDTACAVWGTTAVKENSRRRRASARYPKKQEEKDFTLSRVLCPCCNYIVTLLISFCNRVL